MQELEKEYVKEQELKLELVRIGYLEKVSRIAERLREAVNDETVLKCTNELLALNRVLELEIKAFNEVKEQYERDYGEDYE